MNSKQKHNLFMRYVPLALSVTKRYNNLDDDRFQEAFLGLWEAVLKFDVKKGKFGPYARKVITSKLNRMWRDDLRGDLPFEDYQVSIEAMERVSVAMSMVELRDAIDRLGSKDKVLVDLRLQGKSQVECSLVLGVSQATISRMLLNLVGVLA